MFAAAVNAEPLVPQTPHVCMMVCIRGPLKSVASGNTQIQIQSRDMARGIQGFVEQQFQRCIEYRVFLNPKTRQENPVTLRLL